MQSDTTTTPSTSYEPQGLLVNLASSAFSTQITPNNSVDSINPSPYYVSGTGAFVSPKISASVHPCHHNDLLQPGRHGGSLPLKKRRVIMLLDEQPHPLKLHSDDGSGFRTISGGSDHYNYRSEVEGGQHKNVQQQQHHHHHHPHDQYRWDHDALPRVPMNVSSLDKMNTLSLIAAAAAVKEGGGKFSYQPNASNFTSSFSPFDRVDQMRGTSGSFVQTYYEDNLDESSTASDVSSSRSTSSTNASAQPENGSHKLLIRNNYSTPSSYKKFQSSSSDDTSLSGGPSSSIGQDKRYTGLSPDQVRCLATTTRGRPCTYTAVQCTKYCFLHADYDTNPPPRRSKSNKSDDKDGSITSSHSNTDDHDEMESDQVDRQSGSPSLSVDLSAKKETKSTLEVMGDFKKRRTNAKFAEKHAISSRPLLSMMATDQWFGQSVEIAVGPFEGRKGTVQKWGNGWITVLIEGVGFHNRRSFELYLNTCDSDDSHDVASTGPSATKSRSVGKKKKASEKVANDPDQQLFRCISRDVVSPSPPTTSTSNFKRGTSNGAGKVSRTITPKPANLLSPRSKKDCNLKKSKRALANNRDFPESPLPQSISDGTKTPVPGRATLNGIPNTQSSLMLPTPKVTPFPEKAVAVTHTLSAHDRTNDDLQFPTNSDSAIKESTTGIKAIDSALVFRPSMGERTRGRSTSLGENRSIDACSDSVETAFLIGKVSKKRANTYTELSSDHSIVGEQHHFN